MAAAAAAACLCSCTEQLETSQNHPDDSSLVDLTVMIPNKITTKAAATTEEKTVNDLQVYVFNADGTQIEAYAHGASSSITAKVALGDKVVAALVNSPVFTTCETLSDLKAHVSDLSENSPTNFVMFGLAETTVTTSATVSVEVDRLAARIMLGKITNAIDVEQYKDEPIKLNKIYLINVGSKTPLGGGASLDDDNYYNKSKETERGNVATLLSKNYSLLSVAKGMSYTTNAMLYCYPNSATEDSSSETWSARFTRLVVEVVIANKVWYYPITIDQPITSNTSYEIPELKITRLGSTSPDVPLVIGDAQFSVNVKEWDAKSMDAVEI